MKLTILGSGSSAGVPIIGCDCAVCSSSNPKNDRGRCSALVEVDGKRLLIDTSPDLRRQALDNDFKTVDSILFTHAHADHTHGLDEVRTFNFHADKPIAMYANKATYEELNVRFDYAFFPKEEKYGWFRPCLEPNIVKPNDVLTIEGVEVEVLHQLHGKAGETLGFIFNNKLAYCTDLNYLSEQTLERLHGIDVWVVGCLRREEAPTHAHLDLLLKWQKNVQAKQLIVTHMGHDFDYDELTAELPSGIMPAYDGLVVTI
jgi:phosphoribosyl 1,2-cyclic phosphate phosphodiesterase